jgi:hypothetical protein
MNVKQTTCNSLFLNFISIIYQKNFGYKIIKIKNKYIINISKNDFLIKNNSFFDTILTYSGEFRQ